MFIIETSTDHGKSWKEDKKYQTEKAAGGRLVTLFTVAESPFMARLIKSEYQTANVVDFWQK